MATTPDSLDPAFDLRAQVARIDRMQARLGRQIEAEVETERRFAPLTFVLVGMTAASVFFAAGIAFGLVFLN